MAQPGPRWPEPEDQALKTPHKRLLWVRRFWPQKRSCLVTGVAVLSPVRLVTRSPCALTTAAATTASWDWACRVKGDPQGCPLTGRPTPHRRPGAQEGAVWRGMEP